MTYKALPSNEDAERVVLGAVLMDNDLMKSAAETLEAEHFYSPLHRRVFTAMLELHSAQRSIDPIVISEILKRDGPLEAIGGTPTITKLAFGLPQFSNIDEYLGIVHKKALARELIRVCTKIQADALAEDSDTSDLMMNAQTLVNDLCLRAETGGSAERFETLATIIDRDVYKTLDDLVHSRSRKIKTGFERFDEAIGNGITLSDVMLIAAETGAGKSAFALQIAYQIAKEGTPVAFLAGEMSNGENVNRLLSQVSQITNLNWLVRINQTEHDYLVEWANYIKQLPLFFDHRTTDLHTLSAHLKSIVRRHGVKVLVIDYIQLLKVNAVERRNRTERIAEVSQEIKRIAQDLGIAIIEVAQFNREGAKSNEPSLHDLEGSGQLEKDASLICLMSQDPVDRWDDKNRKYRAVKVRIVKGRNAGLGEIEGKFYGPSLRFEF